MFPDRKLLVWTRAHSLAIDVLRDPRLDVAPCGRVIATPLRGAALSVPANIAEGAGSDSHAQFARFLAVAIASAHEMEYHLLAARDCGLLPVADHKGLAHRVEEINKMLFALLRSVRRDPRRRRALPAAEF